MKVAVFGATGYGGQLLVRLLLHHPEVTTILPVSSSAAGSPLEARDEGLGSDPMNKLPGGRRLLTRDQAASEKPEAVFSALPPGVSARFCEPFFDDSVVFDLSADFRLEDETTHQSVYGFPAPFPERRPNAVYGLTEIHGNAICEAGIVAVPGCYPTCTLLALLPLAKAGLLDGPITVNAVSGISGAGRKAEESFLFVERSESVAPYNPGNVHRHFPEMVQELRRAGSGAPLFFTPHLVPMRRGMEATITLWMGPEKSITPSRIASIYKEAYHQKPFIRLRDDALPDTRDVVGSNRCDIGWRVVSDPGGSGTMLYVFSVIDNLVKGAAGGAVQAFNLRFGHAETAGLPLHGEV